MFKTDVSNNIVFINPSTIVYNDYSILQLNYSNHLPMNGLYSTYGVSYFHNLADLNSSIGISVIHDRQFKGSLTNTVVNAYYSYKTEIGFENALLFGLSGGYNFIKKDYSNLTFENNSFGIPVNSSKKYPDINTGLSFVINKIHILGLSVSNLMSKYKDNPFSKTVNLSYYSQIENYNYHSLISYIEPVINISVNSATNQILYGCNIGFSDFKTGILLNQSNFSVNSSTILLGISFENYDLIYTYNINLSGVVSINPKLAAHEVTFINKIQYKKRRSKHKAIKCPKI